jgi:hypothetical protein
MMSSNPTVGKDTGHWTVSDGCPLGTVAEHRPLPPATLNRTVPPGRLAVDVTVAWRVTVVPWITAADTLALVCVGALLVPKKMLLVGPDTAPEPLSGGAVPGGVPAVKTASI